MPNEVKVELFRSIFECRVAEFTYALVTEVPADSAQVTTKPWTTLVAMFLMDPDNKLYWYKMSVGSGGLLAQCFECMRVCPIATQAPLADPILRSNARRDEAES